MKVARGVATLMCCGVLVALALASTSVPISAAGAAPSAIGDEAVFGIVVSPIYKSTGLVVVASGQSGCTQNCLHLWISHDGGASWSRAAAAGWSGQSPVIGVDSTGREILYARGDQGLIRSDDEGGNWTTIAPAGWPTIRPTYGADGAVAVAAKADYLLYGTSTQPVKGSGGTLDDWGFTFSPGYPAIGAYSAALLVGADKNSGAPVIQRCNAVLTCSGASPLSGDSAFAFPVSLYLSSAFAQDGAVFARAGRGLYKSTDGGVTFLPRTVISNGASVTVYSGMALAPGYREAGPVRTLYVALLQAFQGNAASRQQGRAGGGIFASTDAGRSWADISPNTPLDGGAGAVAVAPDGRLFAGYMAGTTGYSGLLCSTDGGTWRVSCPPVGRAASRAKGSGAVRCIKKNCTVGGVAIAATPTASPGVVSSPSPIAGLGKIDKQTGPRQLSSVLWAAPIGVGLVAIGFLIWRRGRGVSAPPV